MNIIKKIKNKLTYLKSERYVKQKQRELEKVISRNSNLPRIYESVN